MRDSKQLSRVIVALSIVMALGGMVQASEPFIAQITMFGGNFAPRGWALCDGQILPIAQNQALFSLLGTTYGGDGRSTFGLPDLRGRVALHPGNGPGLTSRRLGEKGGGETVLLTTNNLPSHRHDALGTNSAGDQEVPGGNAWAKKSRDRDYKAAAPDIAMHEYSIGLTGASQAFNSMPPFLAVNHIIALVGVFPSRN